MRSGTKNYRPNTTGSQAEHHRTTNDHMVTKNTRATIDKTNPTDIKAVDIIKAAITTEVITADEQVTTATTAVITNAKITTEAAFETTLVVATITTTEATNMVAGLTTATTLTTNAEVTTKVIITTVTTATTTPTTEIRTTTIGMIKNKKFEIRNLEKIIYSITRNHCANRHLFIYNLKIK